MAESRRSGLLLGPTLTLTVCDSGSGSDQIQIALAVAGTACTALGIASSAIPGFLGVPGCFACFACFVYPACSVCAVRCVGADVHSRAQATALLISHLRSTS